jgi:hypothetical protein
MSVNLATMGMFKDCCGGMAIGGGAPPYSQNATERVKPNILVRKVELTTRNSREEYLKKIKVKLIDTE